MKAAGSLLIAVVALFSAAARAQEDADVPAASADVAAVDEVEKPAVKPAIRADKPYATIMARNMFSLVPIPVVDPNASKPPKDPPPKITPTGIMNIFGRLEALLRIAEKARAGQPAKEVTHVLAEGEMVDEVTVVSINREDGIIVVNNHGERQELPLVAAKDASPAGGPASAPAAVMNARAGMSAADRAAALRNVKPNAARPMPVPNAAAGGGVGMNGTTGGAMTLGGPGNPQIYQPQNEANSMTPEQQAFLIEAQRKVYQQQGSPVANLLPPTRGDAKQMVDQIDQMGVPPPP